ncbi:MAG: DUF373 family protein [Candidatus Aenigmatarchaeota archaeon]
MNNSQKTIIICIDRDNDIGEKTKFKGPIIGEKDCLEAAKELLLNDPEDSDANSIFGALKIKKELEEDSEVVILTGDKDVGLKSDKVLSEQLELVINKLKPKNAILVTDGAEDEYIIPIIQSRLPIISLKRIVVKQSETLESSYYVFKDFIKNITSNPKASRLFIGLPSIAIILIAIFGAWAWRLILLTLGAYLLIKGFQLEDISASIARDTIKILMKSRMTLFSFVVGFAFLVSGIVLGYNEVRVSLTLELLQKILIFLKKGIPFFSLSFFFFWVCKVTSKDRYENIYKYLTHLAVIFAISIFSYAAVDFLLDPKKGFGNLIYSIFLGFFSIGLFVVVEKLHAIERVKNIKSSIRYQRLKKKIKKKIRLKRK